MTGLSPGIVLPKDMNQRQWEIWNREQSISAVVADGIAAHEAAADPHAGYVLNAELTAAIAALNLASGTYTPTLTNVANLDSSTPIQCQYLRVGSIVHVTGGVTVDPTAGAPTLTRLGISLPIASNLGAAEDCAGVACLDGANSTQASAAIIGDATNNRAEMNWASFETISSTFSLSFSYEVI